MISPGDFTGNKFFSRIPDTDQPTRVHLTLSTDRGRGIVSSVITLSLFFIFLLGKEGWDSGGLAGAWREISEVSGMLPQFLLIVAVTFLFWGYKRNRGAYFFRNSIVKGSRLTRSWMLSWKSSLYSEVSNVAYDSDFRGINLAGPNSNVIMRLPMLSESEEALLWPLIQSKIGIDKLNRSATQRIAEVHDDETRKSGWKTTLIGASLFIVLIVYLLWQLTHLG